MKLIKKESKILYDRPLERYYYDSLSKNSELEAALSILKEKYEWLKCTVYFDNDDATQRTPYTAEDYDHLMNALSSADLNIIDNINLEGRFPGTNDTFNIQICPVDNFITFLHPEKHLAQDNILDENQMKKM